MNRDIKKLIAQMTLEEKAQMCSGRDFWHLNGVERLGIPSIRVADGPHGLRKQYDRVDHLGLAGSVPATCFPTAAGLACSWDRDLIRSVGAAIGEECQAEDVAILLGPGTNIKRSPLCGRNFEYFSEDPYLSSEMAGAQISGVQSQGVGTSLKHFAANNQEHRRMSVDVIADERTLREIYLASFEGAVKQAQPWTVMCAYNRIHGVYASENKPLLTDILKEEWGHQGFVVSDWGAVDDRVAALEAGLELEMPPGIGNGPQKIAEAVKNGQLAEEVLNSAVERLLKIIFMAADRKKPNADYDRQAHHELARKAAAESMVLLKNEDGILPLKTNARIAVIGPFAETARYQGGGSSHVAPTILDQPLQEMKKLAGDAKFIYSQGYRLDADEADQALEQEALRAAEASDCAVVFAGLPDWLESEGYDRPHMRLPDNQNRLISMIARVQPNTIVVLMNGSPVEMPWVQDAKAILEAYLGGQGAGSAIAQLLFGMANPCGKLAETFPVQLSDNPSYLFFPGEGDRVEYREGLYVGYRYYDKKQIQPLFPFGHGLSYTTFEYSSLKLDKRSMKDHETLEVKVTVKNTGARRGKEIVQLYVTDEESQADRPVKELKGFSKVDLLPGEEKEIAFTLDKRAFAYYNTELKDWHVESGHFTISIGASSRDIRLSERVYVESTVTVKKRYHRNTPIGDLLSDPNTAGKALAFLKPFIEDSLASAREKEGLEGMVEALMRYFPLRSVVTFGGGKITEPMIDQFLDEVNGP